MFFYSRVDLIPRDQRRLPGVPAGAGRGCGGSSGCRCGGVVVLSWRRTHVAHVPHEGESWLLTSILFLVVAA